MVALFKKLSIFFLSIYIMSLYIFQYNAELNIISHILFVIFIGVSCAYIFLRGEFILSSSYINLFAFGILALLSYFWAIDKSIVVGRNRTLFILIALAIIIINIINDEETLKQCIKAIFIGGMIMCLYSLFYYGPNQIFNSIYIGNRLGGEINQENTFGLYSGVTFILGMYYAIYERKKHNYILAILPFLLALSSGSRKAILVLAVGIGVLFCFKISSKKVINIILALFISSILIYFIYYLSINYDVFNRFRFLIDTVIGKSSDSSIITRISMIKFGLNAFLSKPILGYGTEQYNVLYNYKFGSYRPSHNNFIQLLVNYGVVGFIIYFSLYYRIIIKVFKNINKNKNLSIIMLTIIAIILANNFSANLIYDKFTYIFISIGIALVNIYNNKSIENEKEVTEQDPPENNNIRKV